MFWGIVVKSVAKVQFGLDTTVVRAVIEKLDPVNPSSLFLRKDGKKTLLAVLSSKNPSAQLNLEFEFDEEVTFLVEGEGKVHLTGKEYEFDDEGDSVSGSETSSKN